LRDVKISANIERYEEWEVNRLTTYGRLCARALARAHARSGDAALIAGYMGSSSVFDDAICEFAVEYSDQNQRDYRAFVKAVREGRLEAQVEESRMSPGDTGHRRIAIRDFPRRRSPGWLAGARPFRRRSGSLRIRRSGWPTTRSLG
jgi:hypothetical protein